MGRPVKYDSEQILDAALVVLSREGVRGATVTAIAEELGAPSGSVYHRFASRDELLATLWLRTVEDFQASYLEHFAVEDPMEAARGAALHILYWARRHPAEGRLLLLYRREDLMGDSWPDAIAQRARRAAREMDTAFSAFAKRLWTCGTPDLPRLRFALASVPYAGVRRPLSEGKPIPKHLDTLVVETVDALLRDAH